MRKKKWSSPRKRRYHMRKYVKTVNPYSVYDNMYAYAWQLAHTHKEEIYRYVQKLCTVENPREVLLHDIAFFQEYLLGGRIETNDKEV